MVGRFNSKRWLKVTISILLTSFLLQTLSRPINVTSAELYFKNSDNFLYEQYIRHREGDPVLAVMYLWAYIQRDPPAYVNNTDGFGTTLIAEVQSLVKYIYEPARDLKLVNAHINSCGCYPCNKCQLKSSGNVGVQQHGLSQSPLGSEIKPPPDVAVVCSDGYYEGQCRLLPVGTYNNAQQIGLPNDSISSVMVGSRVKITLYVHGGLTGESIMFTSNDPDLSDNWIDSRYRWDNNTTSVKVESR